MTPADLLRELSDRELQVLALITGDTSNREAGEQLKLSVRTVEKHRQRIMKKLKIHNHTRLVHLALATGLVENLYAEESKEWK